jgi:hypothetical protein
MFLPLRNVEFVRDKQDGSVRLRAIAGSDVDWKMFRRLLPTEFQPLPDGEAGVLSNEFVLWTTDTKPTE